MSRNLYSISSWASTTTYRKNDIIYQNSYYYYATQDHTSGAGFASDLANNLWTGIIVDSNGKNKPYFIWNPTYPLTINTTPRVKSIRFGDGYEQRLADGINNILLDIDINFDNRDIDEYTAILHFLKERKGIEYFVFTPPPPYNNNKRFICRNWQDSQVAYNNFSIRTKFEEIPA